MENTKCCSSCKTVKPVVEMCMRDGKPSTRCKACSSEYHQKYNKEVRFANTSDYAAEKARAIEKYHRLVYPMRLERKITLIRLLGGSCNKCGYARSAAALDFHHRNPNEKKYTVSRLLYHAKDFDKALEEVKKCDLLCANCHRETTYEHQPIMPQQEQEDYQPESQARS